jgi:transcriptional regulator
MTKDGDIGIAILHAKTPFGVRRTQEEIAAYAGITRGGVFMLEQRALQKLRRKLFLRNDPVLRELCTAVFK